MKIKKEHYLIVAIPFVFILFFFLSNSNSTLPPIDIRGHTETYPNARILKSPMDISTHKHILEHVPSGKGGVIINYNCEDFQCEPSLLEKLESFAYKYKEVYVAPYKNMKAKIVVSKYGKRIVLDEYDEEKITNFIEEIQ